RFPGRSVRAVEPTDFERLGIYDPEAPGAEDHLKLLTFLTERGAGEDELVAAARAGRLGGLATELAVRRGAATLDFEEVARRIRLEPEAAARYWMALGFADPAVVEPRATVVEAEALGRL